MKGRVIMSLASYIATPVEIPLTPDEEIEDSLLWVGSCFADESSMKDVKEKQFTLPYVYEISSNWGIEIHNYAANQQESKAKLLALIKLINPYLQQGDHFELYSCWVGEEYEEREYAETITIGKFDINKLKIYEKTYLQIYK